MILPFLRRRRKPASSLFEAPRAGIDRVREALPSVSLADVFVDLASRTGVDLGEVAERVFDRLGEVVSRAEEQATGLAETETAHQLRDLAARAAGRAAELAYRTGAERLLEAMPQRQRRSNRNAILLSAGIGLVAGAGIACLLMSRRPQRQQAGAPNAPNPAEAAGEPEGANHDGHGGSLQPVDDGLLGGLRQRLRAAGRAARSSQAATERRLWREYHADLTEGGGS